MGNDQDDDDQLPPVCEVVVTQDLTPHEIEDKAAGDRLVTEALLWLLGEDDASKAAHRLEHDRLMTPAQIEAIGHLIAGDEPGWQSRFARSIDISRNHVSMLLSGGRPATDAIRLAISQAADAAAVDFEARAKKLRLQASRLRF